MGQGAEDLDTHWAWGGNLPPTDPLPPTDQPTARQPLNIQVMKIMSLDEPKPYRLVETYLTSEGPRTRICSGAFAAFDAAYTLRAELQAIVDGAGRR